MTLEPIKFSRVVDQDAVARRLVRDVSLQQVHQIAVVDHPVLAVEDVRPVGAPDGAGRRRLGERAAERDDVVIGRAGVGDAVAVRQLDPPVVLYLVLPQNHLFLLVLIHFHKDNGEVKYLECFQSEETQFFSQKNLRQN